MTCMLCGVTSGVVYDVLYIARVFVCGLNKQHYSVKDKIFTVICDILYFIIFALMFVFISVCFEFYRLRLYMFIACAAGAIIYLKSLHVIIAFLIKKVYNKINKRRSMHRVKHGRRKAQQNNGGDNH